MVHHTPAWIWMSMMDHDISPSWNAFAPPDLIGMLNRRYSPFNSRQTKEQRGKNNDRESPYNGIEPHLFGHRSI